uniref:Sulfhydryl oxidase n=1 Tax=Panagrolaimus sp. ES5 TaxID=591445 RepID=A0AC34FJM6_9BILA
MDFSLVLTLLCIFGIFENVSAEISSMDYKPNGENTLLYQPGYELIMHLDQDTFDDTVFEKGRKNSFVIEFYADWCGHCRSFAPAYREFASEVRSWRNVTQVATMNCADIYNKDICKANDITTFPTMKYFPRNSKSAKESIDVDADSSSSAEELRQMVAKQILDDYEKEKYEEWSMLSYVNDTKDLKEELEKADHVVYFIEEAGDNATAGAEFLLDMYPYRNEFISRRADSESELAKSLDASSFPYVVVYAKDNEKPIFAEEYSGNSTFKEILETLKPKTTTEAPLATTTRKYDLIDCESNPEKCATLYYTSESDMLKAIHYALRDEVIRPNEVIKGANFTNLLNFVNLLIDYFPTETCGSEDKDVRARRYSKRASTSTLKNSEHAIEVFTELKEWLEEKNNTMKADEWLEKFKTIDDSKDNPFPEKDPWQHCKGTGPEYRGYTCGLWTAFHTLIVHANLNNKDKKADPMEPLKAIQGWVKSFFGCKPCKKHFIEMTEKTYKMDKEKIKNSEDAVLYLWNAHNIVNERLHGKPETEDPQFLKYQFPPEFLCKDCQKSEDKFDDKKVMSFLNKYYTKIKPIKK